MSEVIRHPGLILARPFLYGMYGKARHPLNPAITFRPWIPLEAAEWKPINDTEESDPDERATGPANCWPSDASGPSFKADDRFALANNDRDGADATRMFQHLFQFPGVCLYIKIDRLVAVG